MRRLFAFLLGVLFGVILVFGAVAGAAREAVSQIVNKAIGLNIGGKIAIARYGEHISVAIFFGIGLLHLNEMSIGLGHRVIYSSMTAKEEDDNES